MFLKSFIVLQTFKCILSLYIVLFNIFVKFTGINIHNEKVIYEKRKIL